MSGSYETKVKMYMNVMDHIPNERVPSFGILGSWVVAYAGTTFDEATKDVQSEIDVFANTVRDFEFDGLLAAGMNQPFICQRALGYSPYHAAPDGTTMMVDSDTAIIFDDEAEQYAEDPIKFLKTVALGRRYPTFRITDDAERKRKLKEAGKALFGFAMAVGKQGKAMKALGTPVIGGGGIMPSVLDLYMLYRGYVGGLVDLRRRPETVKKALVNMESFYQPLSKKNKPFPWTVSPVTSPNYLTDKLADEFFWPSYDKAMTIHLKTGANLLIYAEGKWGQGKFEHFKEFPKNRIFTILENDDFWEINGLVGDHISMTYPYPITTLCTQSPEEIRNSLNDILDRLDMPGVAMAFDKNIMSPGDVSPEQLRTFCDTVAKR